MILKRFRKETPWYKVSRTKQSIQIKKAIEYSAKQGYVSEYYEKSIRKMLRVAAWRYYLYLVFYWLRYPFAVMFNFFLVLVIFKFAFGDADISNLYFLGLFFILIGAIPLSSIYGVFIEDVLVLYDRFLEAVIEDLDVILYRNNEPTITGRPMTYKITDS